MVNATMEKAIRVVSIERGRDPRVFTLVAFGGAGALHACALAEALSIPRVIVPAFPGALSALGILASDVVKDYSHTILKRVSGKNCSCRIEGKNSPRWKHKRKKAKDFREESWQGRVEHRPSIDVRYRGQGYELNLPFTPTLLKDFEAEHHRRYGYTHPNREIELVTLRLRALLKTKKANVGTAAPGRPSGAKARQALPARSPSPIQWQET